MTHNRTPNHSRQASVPADGIGMPQERIRRLDDGTLLLAAPAKINLNLLVGPPRANGFHTVDSLVARVSLYDQLALKARNDVRVEFACTGADCGSDERNLALRAARLLADRRRVPGADIRLTKSIPPGSGMGGGSSDAAAALAGLNELWGLGLGPADLRDLAAGLGSDVPLFIGPPAARATGRGELLEPLNVHVFWAVLYLGAPPCPTAKVYQAYDQLGAPHMGRQIDLALLAQPPSRWRGMMTNDLLPAARQVRPQLGRAYDRLTSALSIAVCMTGSGGGLYALCDDSEEARSVLAAVPADMRGDCRIVSSSPW